MPAIIDLYIKKPNGYLFNEPSIGDIYAVSEEGKGESILSITFRNEMDLLIFHSLIDKLLGSHGDDELKSSITLKQVGLKGTKLYVDGFSKPKEKIIFTKEVLRSKRLATVIA